MKELKLKSDEIGWVKYCLIRTASANSKSTALSSKEQRFLWKLLEKIEDQEKELDLQD